MKILLLCVALLLTWDNGMVLGEQEFSDNELQGRLNCCPSGGPGQGRP